MKRSSRSPVLGVVAVTCIVVAGVLAPNRPADAATITAAYAVGHRDVTINGYGASGLGAFVLRSDDGDADPGAERTAFCIEAHTSHSTTPGRYRRVANQVASPQLDYLLWKYGVPGSAEYTPLGGDHDTATAVAALAWYHAGASRRGGGAVWSNPATGSPVSPTAPHVWHQLPTYTGSFPVGLRSGANHLDAVERRVHELFVEAEARRGPWTMSGIDVAGRRASVTVTGPGGPIAGVGGVRFVVRDRGGDTLANTVVTTDGSGVAAVEVPELPSGGTIEASMFAPGVHHEWDGDGDVQRLSTGTSERLERRHEVEPASMFVDVVKRASDPYFSPAGARFALLDADGRTIATTTTDADGRGAFGPVDHGAHPAPFTVRELEAPPGLQPSGLDVAVPEPVSLDRSAPTVVEVVNHPVERSLVVHKQISDPRVGPRDRSGFEFVITRTGGDRSFGTVVTGADGRAGPIALTVGRFDVCERGRPAWAAGLQDPGCQTVDLTLEHATTVEMVYTNVVPPPSISTRVRTDSDGDQILEATGGEVVDVVSHHGLVPGTEYRLEGTIHVVGADGAVATDVTASTIFVPEAPEGEVEVVFDVPADAGIPVGVVYQHLVLGDEVVASHADPADRAQTFWVPSIDTVASATSAGLIDTVTFHGMPPGNYAATAEWHLRSTDGRCIPADTTATMPFAVDDVHTGTVTVGPAPFDPGRYPEGVTLVAFQTVSDVDTGRVVAAHHDCEAVTQTVEFVPAATTSTTTTSTTPEPMASTTVPITATSWPRPTTTTTTTPTTTTTVTPTTSTAEPTPARRSLPATGTRTATIATALALMALGAGVLGVLAGVRNRSATGRR